MEIIKDIVNAQYTVTKMLIDYNQGFVKGFLDEYEKKVRQFNRQ